MMSLITVFSVTACKKSNGVRGIVDDEKTINVRMYKAGHGVEWAYELVDKFEELYADEGYKVNILTPSYDMTGDVVVTELMQGYEKTGVDLYITGNVLPQTVGANGEYGVLCEDLESIFESLPINYDGTEEETKIADKIRPELYDSLRDDDGTLYELPSILSAAGLVVNTVKLEKYGLEIPRTTNELLDCFHKIYLGHNGMADSESTGIFPLTYVPGSSNGYTQCLVVNMVAQHNFKEFKEIITMQQVQDDGTLKNMKEDGWKVFGYPGVEEMLTVAYEIFDTNVASYGTAQQTLDQAQAQIMRPDSGAIFMANGSWMLNEVKLNYKNNLDDIAFINNPVISSVGVRVFGADSKYKLSDDKCEEMLCFIIDLVDQNKTIDEIVAAVKAEKHIDIDKEDAQEIATARGVYYNRSGGGILVTKGTTKMDIVSLFLRMLASEDCADTILENANSCSAYSRRFIDTSKYEFVTQASAVMNNVHAATYETAVQGYRKVIQSGFGVMANWSHISTSIVQKGISVYDGKGALISGADYGIYRTKAKEAVEESLRVAQERWDGWVANDK